MHNDLLELGWTAETWRRVVDTVTEEALKVRIAAQMLPIAGPEHPSTIAIPEFAIGVAPDSQPGATAESTRQARERLTVDSSPTLHLTTLAVNVYLRSHEVRDPNLHAGLGMFRRAANYIARLEDALAFNGRAANSPPAGLEGIPSVFTVSGDGNARGLVLPLERPHSGTGLRAIRRLAAREGDLVGDEVITAIIEAIGELDARGQPGPYAVALAQDLFAKICTPNHNLVLPRDRVLAFVQGPLLRATTLRPGHGVVVALSGCPVELVVGSEIGVRYLQTTLEPRYVFRVSERVALRIREENAIAVLACA